MLDSADTEGFHHHRRFCCSGLFLLSGVRSGNFNKSSFLPRLYQPVTKTSSSPGFGLLRMTDSCSDDPQCCFSRHVSHISSKFQTSRNKIHLTHIYPRNNLTNSPDLHRALGIDLLLGESLYASIFSNDH